MRFITEWKSLARWRIWPVVTFFMYLWLSDRDTGHTPEGLLGRWPGRVSDLWIEQPGCSRVPSGGWIWIEFRYSTSGGDPETRCLRHENDLQRYRKSDTSLQVFFCHPASFAMNIVLLVSIFVSFRQLRTVISVVISGVETAFDRGKGGGLVFMFYWWDKKYFLYLPSIIIIYGKTDLNIAL